MLPQDEGTGDALVIITIYFYLRVIAKDPTEISMMEIRVLEDRDAVAHEAAQLIAEMAMQAVSARGRFVMGVSGGTPWMMLRVLTREAVPWKDVHIVQVDERIAPAGHPDRNLTHLHESLLAHTPIDPTHIHAMPVEDIDLERSVRKYAENLQEIAGIPPVLDLIHLGMGPDGHTASLVPGDPVMEVNDTDVALTGIYQGRRRLTLTFPIINRSRRVLWVITGHGKREMFKRLCDGDESIPAGRISRTNAVLIVDKEVAGET